MPILAEAGEGMFELSVTLGIWILAFIATMAGLFISLYLCISHDDLDNGFIEPIELSNSLSQVSKYYYLSDNVVYSCYLLTTYVQLCSQCYA